MGLERHSGLCNKVNRQELTQISKQVLLSNRKILRIVTDCILNSYLGWNSFSYFNWSNC
jgi:hypothetical protein